MKAKTLPTTAWTFIASALLLSGCASSPDETDPGRSVREAYSKSPRRSLLVQNATSPIAQKKVVPVITAPKVFAIYVPGHVDADRDMYVGEHWLFVKLQDASWNLVGKPKKPVTTDHPAGMNSLEKALPGVRALNEILVPHKRKTPDRKGKREYINGD